MHQFRFSAIEKLCHRKYIKHVAMLKCCAMQLCDGIRDALCQLKPSQLLQNCTTSVHSTRNLATDCVAAVGCIREHCNSSASAAAVWFSGQYRITDDPPAAQCAVDNPLLYHGLAHYFSQARNPSKCTQCHNGSEPSCNNGFLSQTSLPRLVDPFLHSSPVCPTYRQTHRQTTGLHCDICGSGPRP